MYNKQRIILIKIIFLKVYLPNVFNLFTDCLIYKEHIVHVIISAEKHTYKMTMMI